MQKCLFCVNFNKNIDDDWFHPDFGFCKSKSISIKRPIESIVALEVGIISEGNVIYVSKNFYCSDFESIKDD